MCEEFLSARIRWPHNFHPVIYKRFNTTTRYISFNYISTPPSTNLHKTLSRNRPIDALLTAPLYVTKPNSPIISHHLSIVYCLHPPPSWKSPATPFPTYASIAETANRIEAALIEGADGVILREDKGNSKRRGLEWKRLAPWPSLYILPDAHFPS